jgi:hypothetical protein
MQASLKRNVRDWKVRSAEDKAAEDVRYTPFGI